VFPRLLSEELTRHGDGSDDSTAVTTASNGACDRDNRVSSVRSIPSSIGDRWCCQTPFTSVESLSSRVIARAVSGAGVAVTVVNGLRDVLVL
jgi:hypothetical protein